MSVNWRRCLVGVLCSLAIGLFSCTKTSSSSESAEILQLAIDSDPITLDPRLVTSANGGRIAELLFNGLFQKDEELKVVPDLALSFEQPSPTVYRIFLRQGIHFHDGSELTAEDVVSTIESIRDPKMVSPFNAAFSRVERVIAEDRYTVRFDLTEPYAPFLTALCRGIVPKGAAMRLGETFARNPIGTGPYRFKAWKSDRYVELAANVDYVDGVPKNKGIFFQIIKDDNTRILKLLKGDLDLLLNTVPPLLIQKLRKEKGLVVETSPGTVMAYIGTNMTDPLLKKVQVRKAIALAINRDEIIKHRRRGFASKANSILSPQNWAYHHDLPLLSYDPQRAKELLDEVGLRDPDGDGPKMRFELSFKTSTVKERVDIVRMMARQLAKVGIGIRVESHEWGAFFRDVRRGNFQLYSLQWVGVTEPDIFFDIFHSAQVPPQGLNRGGYRNAQIDRLVLQGRRAPDLEMRKNIYIEVQQILLEELPLIPMWYEENIIVYRNRLKGVKVRPDAAFTSFAEIEKRDAL